MKSQDIENHILKAAETVQSLVDAEFVKVGNLPAPNSPLDQLGLKDGKQKIIEYLSHGERGIALEHLVYMIVETEISLSQNTKDHIIQAANAMGMEEINNKIHGSH